jgi:hypothetical protein
VPVRLSCVNVTLFAISFVPFIISMGDVTITF